MIQQLRNSIQADPWPWLIRAAIAGISLLIAVTGYLAKLTLDDIKITAKDTLEQLRSVDTRVTTNYIANQIMDARVKALEARQATR